MMWREFIDRFFVIHKCGGCGEILDYEFFSDALCPTCRLKWNMAKTESCHGCAQSAVECRCMPKELSRVGALCLCKQYFYSDKREKEPQNKLLYFLKKHPNKRMANFIASELYEHMKYELSVLGADTDPEGTVIVNVPRGNRSRRIYGFDQSAFMCERLSLMSGVTYKPLLRRRAGGKEQKNLNRKQRFKNMESLIYIKDADAVKGKYVILFDDVVTTGASMAACTAVLQRAGAKGIICLCVAQTQISQNKAK